MAWPAWRCFALVAMMGIPRCAVAMGEFDDDTADDDALTAEQLRALHGHMDRDGDGFVSRQELLSFERLMSTKRARATADAIVQEMDIDRDGKLSLSEHLADLDNQVDGGDAEDLEYTRLQKEADTQKFLAADTNGDGQLDLEEVPGLYFPETNAAVLRVAVRHALARLDRDGDGRLGPAELLEINPEVDPADKPTEEELEEFRQLDRDGDGLLDEAEFTPYESGAFHAEASLRSVFEHGDADRDLRVTAEELVAARGLLQDGEALDQLLEWTEHLEL